MKMSNLRMAMFMVFSGSMSLTACADYGHHHGHHRDYVYVTEERDWDYGRVIEARPIYDRVVYSAPRDYCRTETVARTERRGGDSFGGTVVGGLVGGAIGHEIGNGRGASTAVGALIGAAIGNDIANDGERVVRYRDREVCHTEYDREVEHRITGYDVTYSYMGQIYRTRTDRHPGDRIAVDVSVRPRG